MTRFLDWLSEQKGRVVAVLFFAVLIGTLWGKIAVLWRIGEDVTAIRLELEAAAQRDAALANRDAAIDYDLRNYMCKQMELRNEDCPHFEGAQIILVAAEGAAGGGP